MVSVVTIPRSFLPASEVTVALDLARVAEGASSFAVIKSASAAIAYYQKINLFEHSPTISPLAAFVRATFARRLGTTPKHGKAPFLWADVMRFAVAYLSGHPAYCHLVARGKIEPFQPVSNPFESEYIDTSCCFRDHFVHILDECIEMSIKNDIDLTHCLVLVTFGIISF